MDEKVNELSAMIGFLVQQAGGEVRVPHDTVEAGLPVNSSVKVTNDYETEELIFTIVERDNE